MRRRKFVVVVGLFLLLTTASAGAQHEAAIEQARTAARSWLALLDGHEFDESWDAAGALLKGAVTRDEWSARWSVTLGPMGSVQSRTARAPEFKTALPGAPEGEYVILEFDTVFEKKQKTLETVILKKEPDGLWRVSGYRIL